MNDDLALLSAVDTAAMIAARQLSPVTVVRAAIDRAERLQPALNCFITLCPEQALAAAREAERKVMRGERLGRLHGVPFSVKDIVDTAGVRTTFGSLLYRDHVPEQDAVAVARLHAEGAILIGKTTTPEFGAKCLTDAPLFGRTRNAWDARHSCGGSSGGAAVSVAAGITAIAVATDGGGSTRIPAACNGVVGLKQSQGVIPHSQVLDAFGNQTYVTPMTRTVGDTALMLQAMAGEHPSDPWSIGVPVPACADVTARDGNAIADPVGGGLRGQVIYHCGVPAGRPLAADVAARFEETLQILSHLGADLQPLPTNELDIEPVWRTINHTVWLTRFAPLLAKERERLSPSLVRQLELAQAYSAVDFQHAMFERTRLFRRVQQWLATAAFIVTPTVSRTALPIDQDLFGSIEIDGRRYDDVRPNWFPWTMLFNMTGHPAVSLPSGFGSDGLPVGVQVVGRFRADADLLRLAALHEAHRGVAPLAPV